MTRGKHRLAGRAAWLLAALSLALLVWGGVWESILWAGDENWTDGAALLIAFASFPIAGALIVSKLGRNVLGWILLAIGFFGGLVVFSYSIALHGIEGGTEASAAVTLAAWFATWTWYPTIQLVFPILLLLFPTGSLPSPRWRPVLWGSILVIVVSSILPMFQARLRGDGYDVDNPVGISAIEDAEGMLGPLFVLEAILCLLALASLVVRFRQSKGDERMQLKWFTFAAAILVISLFLEELVTEASFLFSLGIFGLPVSIGIAILKYRLYEIDVIINRALVYGVLTGLAILVYLGLVFALQILLEPVTSDSDLAVAASTLAVAALIRPLRSRIQGFIDRRFYRRKYDAVRTLGEFGTRLRDEVDLEVVRSDIVTVLRETVQPVHMGVWLKDGAR